MLLKFTVPCKENAQMTNEMQGLKFEKLIEQ